MRRPLFDSLLIACLLFPVSATHKLVRILSGEPLAAAIHGTSWIFVHSPVAFAGFRRWSRSSSTCPTCTSCRARWWQAR